MTAEPKQRLLDRLSEVGAKGITHAEAVRQTSEVTVGALVRKGVIVVRPVGEKETLRVWLSAAAPVL